MATKNPFEQFDSPATPKKPNPFEAFDGQTKPSSAAAYLADTVVAGGQGFTSSVQSLTNVAGADNKVSRALGNTTSAMERLQTPYRQAEKANRQRLINEAEQSGSLLKEIGANLGAFAEAPIDTTVNALGSAAPTLAAAVLTGGTSVPAQIAARVLPGVVGAAQGVGAVKGSIYDAVSNQALPGETPEQTEARAAAAQAYDSPNAPQIALGGALGVLAGTTGIESVAGRLTGRAATKAAAPVAPATLTDVAKAAGMGALKEAPLEGLQGGQERVAGNIALQNEGIDTPTFQGAFGQAALEAAASAPVGGAFGAMERLSQRPAAPGQPPAPPAPAAPPPAPFVNPPSLTGNNAADLLAGQGGGLMGTTDPLRAVVRPSQAMGIDPSAGPLSRVAAAAVDSGVTDQTAMDEARANAIQAEDAAGQPGQEAAADPDAPLIAAIAAYNEDMQGMASPSTVSSRFGITVQRAAELLTKAMAQATPAVDDLFPRPATGAQDERNADAPAAVDSGTGGPVGADAPGGARDAGRADEAPAGRLGGGAAEPDAARREDPAAPDAGRDGNPALTTADEQDPAPQTLEEAAAINNLREVKGQGELTDIAMKLGDYVSNPQEEAQAIRSVLFAQYLGGSVASAMLNALQPVQVTLPYLSQFGGPMRAAGRLKRAIQDVLTRAKLDDGLAAALKRAEEEGIVSPQEVFQLQAQAAGRATLSGGDGTRLGDAAAAGNNALSRVMLVWGKLFGAAEQFNRRVTYIAAYRTATEQRMNDPAAFAKRAVDETQFIYCVDSETECLTTSGWKRRDQLTVGDTVIGVDADGAAVETALQAVHRFDGRHEVTEFSNATKFSMVVTDGHRHVVQNYNSRDKKWQAIQMPTTIDLKAGHQLLRAPLQPVTRPQSIGVSMAALLGWIAAEGNYARFRNCTARTNVRLVQSIHHNPEYVAEIDGLLDRLGGHHKKFITKGGEMATYTLKRPLSDQVRSLMPDKLLTWDMVKSMSAEEMAALIDAFAKGDGHALKSGGWCVAQKQEQNLEVLQAMAAMVGQNATLYDAKNAAAGKVAHLYLHKETKRTMVKQLTKQRRVVEDGVWCPETAVGTWIARRNGAIFVTGNSKANRPQWARGAVGATLFTFKQYSISYVELMTRLARSGPEGRKAALLGIGVLVLMSGLGGLPFIEDLDDVIDGFMQRVMGRNFSSKQARQEFFADLLGEGGADFVLRGVTGLPGSPVDVSGRLGLGNMIPGTGIFQKKESYGRDLLEIAGPAGDLLKRGAEAVALTAQGEVFSQNGAIATISPVAARNLLIAHDMAMTGSYQDQQGRKVIDTTPGEAAFKAIGFQPSSVDRVQDASFIAQRMISLNKIREGEIADKWARGVYLNDPAMVQDARSSLEAWNQANPESPIRINMRQIFQRVKNMRMDKTERLAKTAPKEIREQVRTQLEQGR